MSQLPLAVVTGAARGIGEAAVRKFAASGYAVAALDVNRERGEIGRASCRERVYGTV